MWMYESPWICGREGQRSAGKADGREGLPGSQHGHTLALDQARQGGACDLSAAPKGGWWEGGRQSSGNPGGKGVGNHPEILENVGSSFVHISLFLMVLGGI